MSATNPPGLSPVYAIARDMLAMLDSGKRRAAHSLLPLVAYIIDGGDYRALTLNDTAPLHPDTLALWAAAFGQPADGWRVDNTTGGRVARLEWATDGDALPDGGRVTWQGGKP